MSDIPHVHLSNSIFIILEKDLDRVKGFCETFGEDLFVRKVILTASDLEILR